MPKIVLYCKYLDLKSIKRGQDMVVVLVQGLSSADKTKLLKTLVCPRRVGVVSSPQTNPYPFFKKKVYILGFSGFFTPL